MKKRFEKQVAVVTGASSGIGRASALAFAREGAICVLVARSRDKLESVADEIRAFSQDVLVHPADVSSADSVQAMIKNVIERFGRIDILFNNAGRTFVGGIDGDAFVENVKMMAETDFLGTVHTTRAVLPFMKRQRSGHIMNMSSVVGQKAFAGFGGYSSIMHAVSGFTDALRQELKGSGVNVSGLYPALTQTPLLEHVKPENMPPAFRRLTPIPVEIVARAVLDGISHKKARVVVPYQPRLLMFADAISARLGDKVVELLQNRVLGRILGTYKGSIYKHEQPVKA